MKLRSIILPATALGAAAILLTPSESVGFSTIGGSLAQAQRDVRVFNNFTDTQANNNTTADANWPGYDGAEMAVWKGCVEWGSLPHGPSGAGDPTQSVVGDGGANFDITWQGNATAVGSTNENIHSEISGGSGGVLAYCETPISNGWRIRYYQSWTWQDGPGSVGGGIDLQGVACHEYGHALGLGHSNVGGATMFPSISGTGVAQRSINADDIAGVQFIYGAASATKPVITGVSGMTNLTITGSQFAASGNEVWFTQSGSGGSGTPVKVTGLSSNGSVINVTVPAGAGSGDLLVRKGGSSGNAGLSNAWPVDPTASPPCNGGATIYCTAKVNSAGGTPYAWTTGNPTVTDDNFRIRCQNDGLGAVNGIYFYSATGPNSVPFNQGILCAQSPLVRAPIFQFDDFGDYRKKIDVLPAMVGTTRWYQFWFRDPTHPDGTTVGLSDGIEVTFCN